MPTVTVSRDALFARLGKVYTDASFDELTFEYGVELDDVSVEGGETRYAIAVAANRTDMLCLEGIARALGVFLGLAPPPNYTLVPPPSGHPRVRLVVSPRTAAIRPYVVGAVLRGITFTPESYASFIDLQDKLHANIARRRTLVAIGTHDLSAVAPGDLKYDAVPPSQINFVPLGQSASFRADALMEFYRTDPSVKHIKPYVDILAGAVGYPLITDAAGKVLSLPPIINSEATKLSLTTRDVLIECTGTDLTKTQLVLNTMVTMFSEYTTPTPFCVEGVEVVYEATPPPPGAAAVSITPDLSTRPASASVATLCSTVGATIGGEDAVRLAKKMQLAASLSGDGATVLVEVPPSRPDILHECDVIEGA